MILRNEGVYTTTAAPNRQKISKIQVIKDGQVDGRTDNRNRELFASKERRENPFFFHALFGFVTELFVLICNADFVLSASGNVALSGYY